jgi:hypothetical protein
MRQYDPINSGGATLWGMDAPAPGSAPTRSPKVLIPYDAREAISVACAAKRAGKSETTIRNWCRHGLGRRIGGVWAVSQVALAVWLEGDMDTLGAYHDGARQYEPVANYYRRLGLGDLLQRREFGA